MLQGAGHRGPAATPSTHLPTPCAQRQAAVPHTHGCRALGSFCSAWGGGKAADSQKLRCQGAQDSLENMVGGVEAKSPPTIGNREVGQCPHHKVVWQGPGLQLAQHLLHHRADELLPHRHQDVAGGLLPVPDQVLHPKENTS